jgi:acetyl esterase/lipase
MTGASLATNAGRDPLLPVHRMHEAVAMVVGGLDPSDPRISPLYATFVSPPDVLIQVGQDEILLDDSRRIAEVLRRSGGQVQLDPWPGCPHVWHMLEYVLPEGRAALADVADFVGNLVARTT